MAKELAYLPDFTVGEIVTTFGQSVGWQISKYNIPNIWAETEGEGITVAVLDSTPSWSPIICRNDATGQLSIKTIEELFNTIHNPAHLTEKQEEIKIVDGISIWNGHDSNSQKWTKIKHVLRHPYEGKIKRINLPIGVVDVTPNHSLIGISGRTINAETVKIGRKLSTCQIEQIRLINGLHFQGTKEIAWLLGFWAAEGSVFHASSSRKTHSVTLSNTDSNLIQKSADIIKNSFNVHCRIDKYKDIYTLTANNRGLYYFFLKNNTCNSEKRVPDCIINAPKKIKLEFLRGYNLGDGYNKPSRLKWEFREFTTKSQLLASGLVFLISQVLNQKYNCFIREDKPNIIQITLNKPGSKKNTICKQAVKKIFEIDYKGYVYDLETKTHTFGCGVGPIRVHNTGCQMDHPDLTASLTVGHNSTNNTNNVADGQGHGTHCSGIISANNNVQGIVGVAPKATIIVFKVLDDSGSGSYEWIVDGINQAISRGVDLISMSLGGPSSTFNLHEAVRKAYYANIPIICAAGNSGDVPVAFPARYPETISIGALTDQNLRAEFSQTGAMLDFMAPGVSIQSTYPTSRYEYLSGTSMATPWAAGVVALMMAKHRSVGGATPLNTVEDVREHLKKTTIDLDVAGKDPQTGYGLIDVAKAVTDITAPIPEPEPTEPEPIEGDIMPNLQELSTQFNAWVESHTVKTTERTQLEAQITELQAQLDGKVQELAAYDAKATQIADILAAL